MAIQAKMYQEGSGLPLFSSPDWAVENSVGGGGGCGVVGDVRGGAAALHEELCSNLQRQQMLMAARQMQQQQFQNNQTHHHFHHQQQQVQQPTTASFFNSYSEKKSLEIDQYIHAENERMKSVLQEQRKRDLVQFLSKLESRTRYLLKQKDDELYKVSSRTSQLENLVIKIKNEVQIWQTIARQNELHALNLANTIEQLQLQQEAAAVAVNNNNNNLGELYNPEVDDAASYCDENGAVEAGDELQSKCKQEGGGLRWTSGVMMACQICQARERRVLFLPCRHLVSCVVCDPMVDFCPLCQTEKKASMEVLIQ